MTGRLNRATCTLVDENIYIFGSLDKIVKDIGDKLDIDFTRAVLKLGEIKNIEFH
jgi:hypothetical protein